MGNKKYTIITFFALAIFLVSIAFFTLNISYAYESNDGSIWDITLGSPKYEDSNKEYGISTNKESIDFKVALVDYGDEYSFTIPIQNKGNIDAYLKEITYKTLDDVVGTSSNGKVYHVFDYVTYEVLYAKDNDPNDTRINNNLKMNDPLYAHTESNLKIYVKFLDKSRLTDEQIEVLDNSKYKVYKNGSLVNGFNLNLDIRFNYQELK